MAKMTDKTYPSSGPYHPLGPMCVSPNVAIQMAIDAVLDQYDPEHRNDVDSITIYAPFHEPYQVLVHERAGEESDDV